jgi:hypothetical protein
MKERVAKCTGGVKVSGDRLGGNTVNKRYMHYGPFVLDWLQYKPGIFCDPPSPT